MAHARHYCDLLSVHYPGNLEFAAQMNDWLAKYVFANIVFPNMTFSYLQSDIIKTVKKN
jgi:hypothetical protein